MRPFSHCNCSRIRGDSLIRTNPHLPPGRVHTIPVTSYVSLCTTLRPYHSARRSKMTREKGTSDAIRDGGRDETSDPSIAFSKALTPLHLTRGASPMSWLREGKTAPIQNLPCIVHRDVVVEAPSCWLPSPYALDPTPRPSAQRGRNPMGPSASLMSPCQSWRRTTRSCLDEMQMRRITCNTQR